MRAFLTFISIPLLILSLTSCNEEEKKSDKTPTPVTSDTVSNFYLETFIADVHVGATQDKYIGRVSVVNHEGKAIDSFTLIGEGSEDFAINTKGEIRVADGVTLETSKLYQLGVYGEAEGEETETVIAAITVRDSNTTLRHYGEDYTIPTRGQFAADGENLLAYSSERWRLYHRNPQTDRFDLTHSAAADSSGCSMTIAQNRFSICGDYYRINEDLSLEKSSYLNAYYVPNYGNQYLLQSYYNDSGYQRQGVYRVVNGQRTLIQNLEDGLTNENLSYLSSPKASNGTLVTEANFKTGDSLLYIYKFENGKFVKKSELNPPLFHNTSSSEKWDDFTIHGDYLVVVTDDPYVSYGETITAELAHIYRISDEGSATLIQTISETLTEQPYLYNRVRIYNDYLVIARSYGGGAFLYRYNGNNAFEKIYEFGEEYSGSCYINNEMIALGGSESFGASLISKRGKAFDPGEDVRLKGNLANNKTLQMKHIQALSDIGDISQIIATDPNGNKEVYTLDESGSFDMNVSEKQNYLLALYDDYFNLKAVLGYEDQEMVPLFNTEGGTTVDFGDVTTTNDALKLSSQQSFETLELTTAAQNKLLAQFDDMALLQSTADITGDGNITEYDRYAVTLKTINTAEAVSAQRLTETLFYPETFTQSEVKLVFFTVSGLGGEVLSAPSSLPAYTLESTYAYDGLFFGAPELAGIYKTFAMDAPVSDNTFTLPDGNYSMVKEDNTSDVAYSLNMIEDIVFPLGARNVPQIAFKLNVTDGYVTSVDFQWIMYDSTIGEWANMTQEQIDAYLGAPIGTLDFYDVKLQFNDTSYDEHPVFSEGTGGAIMAPSSTQGTIVSRFTGTNWGDSLPIKQRLSDIETIEFSYQDMMGNTYYNVIPVTQ